MLFFLLSSQKFGYSGALSQFCRKRRRSWKMKNFMKRYADCSCHAGFIAAGRQTSTKYVRKKESEE